MDHRTRPVMILEELDLSGIDRTLGGSVRLLPPERPVNRIRARSNLFSVSFLVTSGPPYKPIIVTIFNLIHTHRPQPPTSPPPVPMRHLTFPCAVSRAHAAVPRARSHSRHTPRQRHRQPTRTPLPAPTPPAQAPPHTPPFPRCASLAVACAVVVQSLPSAVQRW